MPRRQQFRAELKSQQAQNGGRAAAILFSPIATCQRHHVEPLAYLRDVLTRIAAQLVSRLAEWLPPTNPPP